MKKKLLIPAITIFIIFMLSSFSFHVQSNVYLPVLMYHDVSPSGTEPGPYSVSEEKFRSDMEYLRSNNYETIIADDLIDYRKNGSRPQRKTVMITFDDGYTTNYSIAYPILKELQLKATVSVIGSNVESSDFSSFMSPAQAAELQESGVIDIQSHTYDLHHSDDLDRNPPYNCGIYRKEHESKDEYQKRLRSDLEKSKAFLQSIGSDLKLLAFPYGIVDRWSTDVLRSMNIDVTLLTGNQLHRYTGNNYNLLRLTVSEHTDLAEILP